MRRQKWIMIGIGMIIPAISMAALPPAAESLRRIKTIAESPAVFEKIGSAEQVIGINESKDGGYVVTTNRCKLYVSLQETELTQLEPSLIGPPKLDIVLGDLKCQKGKSSKASKPNKPSSKPNYGSRERR